MEPLKCELCHRRVAKHQYFAPDKQELYICDKCFEKHNKEAEPEKDHAPPHDQKPPTDPDTWSDESQEDIDPDEEHALARLIDFVLCKACADIIRACKKSQKFARGFKVKDGDSDYKVLIEIHIKDDAEEIDVRVHTINPDFEAWHHWIFQLTNEVKLMATAKCSDDDETVEYGKEDVSPSQLLFILSVLDVACRDKRKMKPL